MQIIARILLFLFVVYLIACYFVDISITDDDIRLKSYLIMYLGIPLVGVLSFVKPSWSKISQYFRSAGINLFYDSSFLAVCIILYSITWIIFGFTLACERFDREIYFISKDGNSTITKSAVNCGAMTGTYHYETYTNHTIGGLILIQYPTKTSDMNMYEWIRVEK